jgi:RHH-type proline utilization regulon transcriptional repressor/proline dehydrogenase/delta 1-pyrroline-5-carboxylate dehydrogenase
MEAVRDDAFFASASCLPKQLERDPDAYCLNWLLEEVSTSIKTSAAGGNASLMSIG